MADTINVTINFDAAKFVEKMRQAFGDQGMTTDDASFNLVIARMIASALDEPGVLTVEPAK